MDELTSTEFRKSYARLTAPTKVLVNGHVIGMWVPTPAMTQDNPEVVRWPHIEITPKPKPIRPIKGASQRERDNFLRAINSGGKR